MDNPQLVYLEDSQCCSKQTLMPQTGLMVTPDDSVELFEHQRENIYGMRKLELQLSYKKRKLLESKCILSDKVGAGKSYTILGLIKKYPYLDISASRFPNRYVDKLVIYAYKNLAYYRVIDKNTIPVSLLVVPHSLYKQWEEYSNNIKIEYFGVNNRKSITNLEKQLTSGKICMVLMNINMLADSYDILEQFTLSRLIVDETESISYTSKDSEKRTILNILNGNFRWFITATPTDKTFSFFDKNENENENKGIYNIFKSEDKKIDDLMYSTIKDTAEFSITVKDNDYINELKSYYPSEALELVNAGCMDRAKKIFGDNLCDKDSLVTLLVTSLQVKIERLEKRLEKNDQNIDLVKELSENTNKLERIKTRLKELNENNCMICND